MTSASDYRQILAKRNAEIVRLTELDVTQRDIARVLSISVSTVQLALKAHRRNLKVEVPTWVPEHLREDFQTIARESGEEAAAAYCRRAKRPAALSLGPCEHGAR